MTDVKRVSRSFDELLDAVPGLRRLRGLTAEWLRVLHDRRAGECTWCGKRVPKGSRTWCGDACVEAFKQRCDPQHFAPLVVRRDCGICQHCLKDTMAGEREAKAERRRIYMGKRPDDVSIWEWREREKENELWFTARGFARGRWREVDHVVPVCHGGGLCTLDNLRLLCGVCHHEHTKQLAAQNAKARKDAA